MNDMRELLAGLTHQGSPLEVLLGVATSSSKVRISGVEIQPSILAHARDAVAAGTPVLVLRVGSADSAHYVIGTL